MEGSRSEKGDNPALVLLASAAFSLLLLGSHVLPLGAVVEPGGDYGLMTWNLWIVNESLTHGRNPFFTDLIYHPLGATLAKHTLVPGFWPVSFLAQKLSGNDPRYPLYSYRASILLCFSLALGLTYLVLRRLGFSRIASCVPAVQYAFSDFDMQHVPHLNHISAAFFLPLTTLALIRLHREPRPARAAGAGALLGAGVYFSELVVFLYLALILAALSGPGRAVLVPKLRALGPRGLLGGALALLLTVAPFLVNWTFDSGKPPRPRQASNWSANLAGFVVPDPDDTPFYGRAFSGTDSRVSKGIGGREVFLGFPLLLFAGLALARRPRGLLAVATGLALFFLLLSLGPTLKVGGTDTGIPLPYALLMKVPPFHMGRTPVRCVLLALFFLAIIAAAGLARATAWRGGRARHAIGGLALTWAVAEVWSPPPPVKEYAVPPGLSRLVPGPVVNLPLSVFDGAAVFLQVFHGRPIATGFVSRRTPAQVEHVRDLDQALDRSVAEFVARVERLGFRNVLLGPGTPREVTAALRGSSINVVDLRRGDEPEPRPPADEADLGP